MRLRFYLGAFGQPGHAFPMMALGERLTQRGHYVTFETWERWRDHVLAAGMEFVPAPEYPVFPTMERPLQPYEAVARATPATRKELVAHAPHVVIHDILTLAPALAAELEGIPTATLIPHLYPVADRGLPPYSIGARAPRSAAGRAFWGAFERPLERGLKQGRDQLNETRRRVGLPPVERLHGGLSADLCLVATFPQLEYSRRWPDHVQVVGPILWEPPADGPLPLPPGDGPLVLVAPSTSHDSRQRLVEATVEGLSGTGARVLASVGGRAPRRALRTNDQTLLVNWLSYSQVMPYAAAVVTHAGHGTLARALLNGVPVVAVPHSGDMGENAARVDWAGVGVRLPWRLVHPTTVRLAVGRVLDRDAAYVDRARLLADWAVIHDGPTRAAELVEELGARQLAALSR